MGIQRQTCNVHVGKPQSERFMQSPGQVAEDGVQVMLFEFRDEFIVNAAVAGFGVSPGMQQVKLENFFEVMQGAVKGHQAEAGQQIVLKGVDIERGQKLAGVQKGVIVGFAIWPQQAMLYLNVIQENFQIMQAFQLSFAGIVIRIAGQQIAFFKKAFPGYSFHCVHVTQI